MEKEKRRKREKYTREEKFCDDHKMYKRSRFPSSGGFRMGELRRYCLIRSNKSWHSDPHSNFTPFLNK